MHGYRVKRTQNEDGSYVTSVYKLIDGSGPFEPWNMEHIVDVPDMAVGVVLVDEIYKLEGFSDESEALPW